MDLSVLDETLSLSKRHDQVVEESAREGIEGVITHHTGTIRALADRLESEIDRALH